MEVTIKTLTPLWTGGAETGKCDRIHETSILGSLRWWMEVLVRGMRGNACDPTKQKCSYDPKKPNNGLCKVCEVFGATGWKRQFRLEVIKDNTKPDTEISSEIKLQSYHYEYKTKDGKTQTATGTPQWYFPKNSQDKPRSGHFTLKIQSLNPKFKSEIMVALIQFIADYSALGARPQMGFGVIKIEDDCIDRQPLYDWLIPTAGNESDQQLPSLKNIFLAKIYPKNSLFDQKITFNLKYNLRQLFRSDKNLRHFIMGTHKGDRIAAKVKISRPYKDDQGNTVMRVWGWIPENADVYSDSWDREKIVAKIHEHLVNTYHLKIWREMNSIRDTVTPNEDKAQAFLHHLLQLESKHN